jgi:5'-nucleotidase
VILRIVIAFCIGAGFWACSDVYHIGVTSETLDINQSLERNPGIDRMIVPYQTELSATMNVQIAFAKRDFERGRPNAALNNWSADAIYSYALEHRKALPIDTTQPVMCLLNVGGLRNPISEGPVSVGDIYKLMPFDNEIVWVEMPWQSISEISIYLQESGGEPLAGAYLNQDTLIFPGVATPSASYWVITSDYLMNGGDHMSFFEKKKSFHYVGALMRDAMLEVAKEQDTLLFDNTNRIQL